MSAIDLVAARRNQIPRGIAYMVASTVLFAAINAIVKWQLAFYPVGEVAFYRALFALVTVAVIILPRSGIAVFRTRRYFGHLQRGVSQFGSMTCMFFAFSMMSLGSAVAISFAQSVLSDAGITAFLADQFMSVAEGSIGAFPRRLLVDPDDWTAARRALTDAGLEIWLVNDGESRA